MRWGAALALSIVVAAAAPARADEAVARDAMARGVAAMGARDPAAALVAFQRAIAEAPDAPVPHRFAGEAHEALAQWAEAVASYRTYLRLRPDSRDATDVQARIDRIVAAHLTGALTVRCDPAGAAVSVDGKPAGVTPITAAALPAGDHTVRVSAPGYVPREMAVTIGAGATSDVECALELVPAVAAPAPPPEPAPPPVRRGTAWYRRPWVWAVAGAVVIAGGATAYLARPDRPDTAGGDIPFP
jgi:tetratricopeptide (TPR) repeat protein